MAAVGYGYRYQQERAALLATGPLCGHCGVRPATTADHQPPLSSVADRRLWAGVLIPSCRRCMLVQGGQLSHRRRPLPEPSRVW